MQDVRFYDMARRSSRLVWGGSKNAGFQVDPAGGKPRSRSARVGADNVAPCGHVRIAQSLHEWPLCCFEIRGAQTRK